MFDRITSYKGILGLTIGIYLINAFILYFGTLYFEKYKPYNIYGMIDGAHPHLQRTVGLFMFYMAMLNFIVMMVDNPYVVAASFMLNLGVAFHYCFETYHFHSLRIEFMTLLFGAIMLNSYWSIKEIYSKMM